MEATAPRRLDAALRRGGLLLLAISILLACGADDEFSGSGERSESATMPSGHTGEVGTTDNVSNPSHSLNTSLPDTRESTPTETLPSGETWVSFDDASDWRTAEEADALRDLLLEGIDRLHAPGMLLSPLAVLDPMAVVVLVDPADAPIVAATEWGAGRVLVVGHEGVLNSDDPGFSRLASNAAAWMTPEASGAPRVAAGPTMAGAADRLGTRVTTAASVPAPGEADIFVVAAYSEWSAEEVEALHAFVDVGGGLMMGGQAWWWASTSGDTPVVRFPGNHILAAMGILITTRMAQGEAFSLPQGRGMALHHAAGALRALQEEGRSGRPNLSDAERNLAAAAAAGGVDVMPLSGNFRAEAERFSRRTGPVVPPVVPASEGLRALALRVQIRMALDLPAEEVRAHPAAADFPGTTDAEARRIEADVTLGFEGYDPRLAFANPMSPRWHGTGAWAPAGAPVSVQVPAELVGAGLAIQIGAHTDNLFHLSRWERAPRITQRTLILEETTTVASGFGGPIYLVEPAGTPVREAGIVIEGAVPMARFVAGEGDDALWQGTDWSAVAPWAELESGSWAMTVPAEDAAAVEDPTSLMAFWEEVMEEATWLGGLEWPRTRAERFVVDRQISAGWMHSGYPIMAHVQSAPDVLSLDAMRSPLNWGPFHEIGHNHQNMHWVFPGTEESSVNLWSVYLAEEVAGVDRNDAHPDIAPGARQALRTAWRTGQDRDWTVWMALETYLQIQEAFGWEALQEAFAAYLERPAAVGPANPAAMAHDWIVTISRAAGHDLSDFHAAWGFDVQPETRTALADLPTWEEHPMR